MSKVKDLYRLYRPKTLKDIEGQPEVVKQLQRMIERSSFHHCVLLCGPSGTGKTTCARIIANSLNCDLDWDFHEYNCAEQGGIETIRELKDKVQVAPAKAATIIYLDESQKLSSREGKSSDSQTALLKLVEDTPSWVYYILATSEEKGIKATLKNRCLVLRFKSLTLPALSRIVDRTLTGEKATIPRLVKETLLQAAEGSGRAALNILQQVLSLDTEEEQLASIHQEEHHKAAFELVKLLVYNKETGMVKWAKVAAMLKQIDLSNVESLRRFVLACARTELLKSNHWASPRAGVVLECLQYNTFDSGEPGFIRMCYEACLGIK